MLTFNKQTLYNKNVTCFSLLKGGISMILEIPDGYKFSNWKDSNNYAYEKNGILYIKGDLPFEQLMYNLTYSLKNKKRCFYCNGKLNSQNRTLDHRIPRHLGGITLPINLEVCCKKCNEEKGALTVSQYEAVRELSSKTEKTKLISEYNNLNEIELEKKGTCLPACWTSVNFRSKIYADFDLDTFYKGKKYYKIKSFYKKYHYLPKPLIISSNNILLDGYLVLMFAKNKKIKKIPTIVLENVIVE